MCRIISVEYLLYVQYYKVAKLQDLIVAEFYTFSFSAGFIPFASYFIKVVFMCYVSRAEYICCKINAVVAKLLKYNI